MPWNQTAPSITNCKKVDDNTYQHYFEYGIGTNTNSEPYPRTRCLCGAVTYGELSYNSTKLIHNF